MQWAMAGVLAAIAFAPMPSRADAWSDVFAAESDLAVFVAADGALIRAPFHLATRETLWTPRQNERIARVASSPDGQRVAWITRAFDHDTTRLWLFGATGVVQRVRYFALQSRLHGFEHSEPNVPTIEDRDARGGRLVQAGAHMRRHACNTLAWTPDGRAVVVGYDGGIAAVPVDGSPGFGVGALSPLSLARLGPSPIFLTDAVVFQRPSNVPLSPVDQLDLEHLATMDTRKHGPGRADFLLYPTGGRWRVYEASDLPASVLRAASPRTVWWAAGREVRAIRVDDAKPTVAVRAPEAIVWLGFDGSHRALVWAAGSSLMREAEDGGDATRVLATGSPIRAAFESRPGERVGIVTDDSLLVWNPEDDAVERWALGGLEPCAFVEGPEGARVLGVACHDGAPRRLARADAATQALVAVEMPKLKGGRLHALASGAWILLYDPAPRAPRTLQAYDVRRGAWVAVENPGVTAWEPLTPPD